ncbi:MAG: ATP synthase F1 subunit delta [Candidatus Omnitrophica bacterium]|nr:ATP synthase F1 subunit delta [Candidatus Omnitrophota bacterium]
MTDRVVARRYGEAFVAVLERSRRLEAGLEELRLIAKTYEGSRDLKRFLGSPEIGEEEKRSLLTRIFSSSIGPETASFIELLLRRDRTDHLPAISEEAVKVSEEHQGILRGTVTTAHPISSAEAEALAKGVAARLGKRVILERRVDPKSLGGARIEVGSTLFDGSVQGSLEKIRRQLLEAKVA